MDERTQALIESAVGYLSNLIDSKDEAWVKNITLKDALEGAEHWAHATWKDYR